VEIEEHGLISSMLSKVVSRQWTWYYTKITHTINTHPFLFQVQLFLQSLNQGKHDKIHEKYHVKPSLVQA